MEDNRLTYNGALSKMSKHVKRTRKKETSQEISYKSSGVNDLHPLLACDIKPISRDWDWPKRPKHPKKKLPEQPDLFPMDFFGELLGDNQDEQTNDFNWE